MIQVKTHNSFEWLKANALPFALGNKNVIRVSKSIDIRTIRYARQRFSVDNLGVSPRCLVREMRRRALAKEFPIAETIEPAG